MIEPKPDPKKTEDHLKQIVGEDTYRDFAAWLTDQHMMRQCWTCQDSIPVNGYVVHIEKCQPGGCFSDPICSEDLVPGPSKKIADGLRMVVKTCVL